MSAFPPHRSTPSIPVAQSLALAHLQTYLSNTQTHPYLHPNARLEVSGPTAGSTSSSITIHNLQRVVAGLRGEWLAPSLDLHNGENGDGKEGIEVAKGMVNGVGQKGDDMGEEGWMDAEEYARQQSVEEGEVEPSRTVVRQEGDEIVAEERRLSKKRKLNYGDTAAEKPLAQVVEEREEMSEWQKAQEKDAKKKAKKLRGKEERKKKRVEIQGSMKR